MAVSLGSAAGALWVRERGCRYDVGGGTGGPEQGQQGERGNEPPHGVPLRSSSAALRWHADWG